MFSNLLSLNRTVYDNMWKRYCTAGVATEDNMMHAQCMLDMSGYRHALKIRKALPLFHTNIGCTNGL